MNIQKVLLKSGKVHAKWLDNKGDSHQLVCTETALPEFYEALTNLKGVIKSLLGFSKPGSDDVLIRGVIYREDDKAAKFFVNFICELVTANKKHPLPFVSPKFDMFKIKEDEEPVKLMINEFRKQAELYITGKRAQQDLPEPKKEKKQKELIKDSEETPLTRGKAEKAAKKKKDEVPAEQPEDEDPFGKKPAKAKKAKASKE